jgi:hypothetical protein
MSGNMTRNYYGNKLLKSFGFVENTSNLWSDELIKP